MLRLNYCVVGFFVSVIMLLLVHWLFLFPSFVFALYFVFGNHLAEEKRSVVFLFLILFLLLCVCLCLSVFHFFVSMCNELACYPQVWHLLVILTCFIYRLQIYLTLTYLFINDRCEPVYILHSLTGKTSCIHR